MNKFTPEVPTTNFNLKIYKTYFIYTILFL